VVTAQLAMYVIHLFALSDVWRLQITALNDIMISSPLTDDAVYNIQH